MSLTTIDIKELRAVRLYSFRKGLTLKAYVNELIEKDMEESKSASVITAKEKQSDRGTA